MANAWQSLRRDGLIARRPYLLIGLVLFAIKFLLDTTVARVAFDRSWTPWDYLISGSTLITLLRVSEDRAFFLTLLAMSLPFVAVGVILTIARLRSVGGSPLLVVLFFLPVLNLLLILILVLLPTRTDNEIQDTTQAVPTAPFATLALPLLSYGTDQPTTAGMRIARFYPENSASSLWASAALTAPFVLLITWLSVEVFSSYGWGVFVALPFVSGVLSSVLHGLRQRRSITQCLAAATLSTILSSAMVLVFGIDGLGCLIMFLPLAIPLSWIGAAVGYTLQSGPLRYRGTGGVVASLLLFVPLFLGAERLARPRAPVYAVTTYVDVDAAPEQVWKHVITFDEIPKPTDWVFRAGVAYPVRAQIQGHGSGAIRKCVFSTGAFVEPITVWNEPYVLKFDVTSNPPAMKEWSPYHIDPPHLHDFMVSHGGQFRLIPLSGGRTRLEGTTWYEHNLWPAGYWRLWSDFIIHRIHRRVLEHVKALSEAAS